MKDSISTAGQITRCVAPSGNNKPAISEERVQILLQRVIRIYQQNFADAEAARAWMAKHGLTDFSIFDRHRVGWSDGRLPEILPGDPAFRHELVQLGLLDAKGRERFAHSLVFPIHSMDGRLDNLWAVPKSGPPSFFPGRPVGLWNVAAAKTSGHIYVTDDVVDALSLLVAGHPNVVAMHPQLGTPDVAALTGWGVQRTTIIAGDTPAALTAANEIKTKFAPHPSDIAILRGCAGANALLRARGGRALAEALVAATHGLVAITIPGLQPLPGGFTLLIGNRRYEIRGLDHSPRRLKATIRAERGGKLHVDTIDFYVARMRHQLALSLVRLFDESADTIEADVAKLLMACEARAAQPDLTIAGDAPADPIPEADRKEAEAMGRDPKLLETIVDDYGQCGFVGERCNKLLAYIVMTSRKTAHPLALMNLSSSGSGKSALQDATLAFCPPDDVHKRSNISRMALFHKERFSIKNKALALEEDEGARNASYPLRVLISSGELVTEVATKDPATGRLVTVTNKVQGPVAVFLTTTSPDLNAETKSRFFIIHADESREQTRAILEHQRRRHTLDGLVDEQKVAAIIRRHQAFQWALQPLRIVNPHVGRLACSEDRLTSRRDLPKMLRLVEAIAFLRQMQKPIKQLGSINYIEVDDVDLKIAAELIRALFGQNFEELSHPGRELLLLLDRMQTEARRAAPPEDPTKPPPFVFTRRQVREYGHWANTRVHRYLSELIDFEYVIRDGGRRGLLHRYVLVWERPGGESQPPIAVLSNGPSILPPAANAASIPEALATA